MFGTILLAVDGSKPTEKAVELAARTAKADGDAIVVIHVTERPPHRGSPRGPPRGDRGAIQLAEQYTKAWRLRGCEPASTFATPCTAPRPASSWTPPTSTAPA
jgi:nucleotide-binding universal stress UspA family protein